MRAVSFKQSCQSIERGAFDPVYYVTGDEDVLKDEFVDLIVDRAVEPASRDFNVDTRSAGDLDAEALTNLVETPPMLAERRVAVVRNLEQWRKNSKVWKTLHQYLDRPSPTTTLVLLHGAGQDPDRHLTDRSTHVTAGFSDPSEVRPWASARAKAMGLELEEDALDHLLAATNHGLAALASELHKLSAVATERAITVDEVAGLVGVRRGETPDDWLDTVLRRDTARAIDLLDVVLHQPGVTAVRLVMSLGTALIGTRIAREGIENGAASRVRGQLIDLLKANRVAGVGRYGEEASRWVRAAERWEPTELDRAIEAAYEADQALKSTTLTDEQGIMVTMLLTFGAREAGGSQS